MTKLRRLNGADEVLNWCVIVVETPGSLPEVAFADSEHLALREATELAERASGVFVCQVKWWKR